MEAIETNPDEGITNATFQTEKQEERPSSLKNTAAKTSKVSEVIISKECYVFPRFLETFCGSVTQITYSFFHFFTSTFSRYFSTGDAYPSTNSIFADKANEILENLAQYTERGFSYDLSLRERSAWSSLYHSGGGVEVCSGFLEKVDFCLKNKEALGLKGYTHQETGEYISYENLTLDDVLAAMIATEMTHSELSHFGRFSELGLLVTIIGTLTIGKKYGQVLIVPTYLYHSRLQTYEADQAGAVLAAKAGYNPAATLFLNEIHDKCRSYLSKALSRIYLTGPSCQDRQAVSFPVVRDWKALYLSR